MNGPSLTAASFPRDHRTALSAADKCPRGEKSTTYPGCSILRRSPIRKYVLAATIALSASLLALAGQAQQDGKYTLRYAPTAGQKWQEKLSGELLDTALQGQPLGVQGNASCDVTVEITAANADNHTSALQVSLAQVEASLNGQASTPDPPAPFTMTLDQAGQVTDFQGGPAASVNFMETGGIPLPVIAVLTHIIRFSADPVEVGDEWTFEDKYVLPSMGEVPINSHWTLAEVKDNVAVVTSKATAALPNFKTANPMAPGTEMEIKGGRVYITELTQKFDLTSSHLVAGEGRLRIDAMVDMQGAQMPITLTMRFSLKFQEKTAEPPR